MQNAAIVDMLQSMSQYWYREWYNKDVRDHLTREQKEAVMKRVSELTLREAIWLNDTDYTSQFPELAPYAHKEISGLQLVTVMEAIFAELYRPKEGQRRESQRK